MLVLLWRSLSFQNFMGEFSILQGSGITCTIKTEVAGERRSRELVIITCK